MKSIDDIIVQNKQEALSLLKSHGGHIIFGSDDDSEDYEDDVMCPWVLICTRHDGIADLQATEVRVDGNDNMEIYIDDWGEWVNVNECLSTTANNVYAAIDAQLK